MAKQVSRKLTTRVLYTKKITPGEMPGKKKNPKTKRCKIQKIAVMECEVKSSKRYQKKLRDSLKQHKFSDLGLYFFLLGLQSYTYPGSTINTQSQ